MRSHKACVSVSPLKLVGSGSVNTFPAATNTHATILELLKAEFYEVHVL
jgi:hypothetical protein